MNYLKLLLLVLVTAGWGPVSIGQHAIVAAPPAGGGWGDSCDTTQTNVYCMDFDHATSTGTTGVDANGTDQATLANMDAGCTSAPCPLSGTKSSGDHTSNNHQTRVLNAQLGWTSDTTDDIVRCRFEMHWVDGAATTQKDLLTFYNGSDSTVQAGIEVDYDVAGDQHVCAVVRAGSNSCNTTADAFDAGETVTMCVEHSTGINKTEVWMNGDCSGASWQVQDSTGAGVEIGGMRLLSPVDTDEMIFDNIKCQLNP